MTNDVIEVQTICNVGMVEGVVKVRHIWVILENAEKPKDERIKIGKQVKER